MKQLLLFILLTTALLTSAQETTVKAVVLNAQTDRPMDNVNVLNLNRVIGTATDQKGTFELAASVNDTLYFSFLGFKSIKVRVSNDMLKIGGTKIALTELAYALEEVVVRPYQLTGYIEIDAKNIVINDNYQYSISGLPRGYEAGRYNPGAFTKTVRAIFNPVGLLHNIFGKRPKQMRKLRKMKEDDLIRNLLAEKFDRETLMELLQLERVEIDDILTNCNYSKQFILTANDLQILDAISGCYEEYKVLNKK
ncbi:MAG: carboxypeptidase-like regulatory domain-containing protein [Flavobacteriaceae bacterium]|nr:carboxypeptidase-like regulatory domain-containing protein [Flavobacteriaceae bacterium]